jgi:hypothetical protein
MNNKPEPTGEELCIFSPYAPKPGMLAAMAQPEKLEEIKELETSGRKTVWKVRGIISDSVPLSGEILEALKRPAHNLLFLNEDPLTIYLHAGGKGLSTMILLAMKSTICNTFRCWSNRASLALLCFWHDGH